MKCLNCGERLNVIDSRYRQQRQWRKRICLNCGSEFYTEEIIIGRQNIVKPEEQPKKAKPEKTCTTCTYNKMCETEDLLEAMKNGWDCWTDEENIWKTKQK